MTSDSQLEQPAGSTSAQISGWLTPFKPRRGLSSGHLQTIVGNYLPRPHFSLTAISETVVVDPSDNSRVLCHCHWQTEANHPDRMAVVLLHGLEGSSNSRYILGLATRAWKAGFHVIRMNMRNCGGTDHLTPTLYNSSLSGDVGAVINHFANERGLSRVALVGYSMGGNLVLKLAGEWGSRVPLCVVAAVCPSIDLAAGSDALHLPINRIYEWHFLRGLMRRYRRKVRLFPHLYSRDVGPIRSLREFDDKIVARYCNFRNSDDYYYRAAAARVVDRISVPTLILRALDDPFIRFTTETHAALLANPQIRLIETQYGGHCAYLADGSGESIHWAEDTVIRYLTAFGIDVHGS